MNLRWRRRSRLSVILPLAAAAGLSVLLFLYARWQEDEALRRTFADRAGPLASAVRVSCDSHLEVLSSLEALFSSLPTVREEEFSAFVARSLNRHPGIRALSWNPRVTAADRERFEAAAGMPITRVDPAGWRVKAPPEDEYVVVRYVEPATDRGALGIDVASEPVRRQALDAARDQGQIVATGPIRLVNDRGQQLSLLAFAPVYGVRTAPATLAGRRSEIRGYATGAFRLGDLVEAALHNLPRTDVAIALFDNQEKTAPAGLYQDPQWTHRLAASTAAAEGLEWREPFVFGGRPWEVRVAATPAFEAAYRSWHAWVILLGGFLFTGLLGALLFMVTSRAARIEALVVRRTVELQVELKERRKAEEVVRLSEARNRDLLENMIGGMITLNERSRIESVNPAAERIFGYREDEILGKNVSILLADAPESDTDSYLKQAHQTAIGRVTELWGRRKNGELFFSEAALFEFGPPEDRRFACNFQDISERREVDRLKSEFVSTVSHELRTPLTSIRGALGLLAAGVLGGLSPEVRDILGLAERNAIRLSALINDILDFERLESGRFEMARAAVDVALLFEQSLDSVRLLADEQRIILLGIPTELRVWADAARVVQVLVNLISNAIKFSPPEREIRVWGEEREEDRVRIFVRDQGKGIPASHQQLIFERFAHVETSDKRDQKGTGLGLAICKAIVEHHGGRIGVDSEPGAGSTFWFDLTAAAPAA
jgi:PAS domain S-box-containing protein